MKIHTDMKIVKDDLIDFADALATGIMGTNTHQNAAKVLRDPNAENKTMAKFSIAANCANCAKSIICAVKTIWHRGSPISIQLDDGVCPECNSTAGFHHTEVRNLHSTTAA